ncbi:benzoate 4-monooxygenase cytochrome-like protein P450 [Cucurbitaria berberidis CBS 394.84]|uniref:Benzoate 4-monooxygenase cytochrome-like protein P450 n=1 Tax=Cucurbitaria berberidis CBS 394.84 TaxID=1168544 RepID=A0A9P4L9R9_9PLEO|nr:benzoate 4-monooxygenase cytochrome-like protein P450 [Cucurbitaria berberidis CBS 394.84]KAF1847536.1 benzoate 4-monooxygenase cytochrome-like protein P450 [Cucurbitaria berberidis CBS 394.84]
MSHVLSIIVLGVVATVFLVFCKVVYNIYFHPLRHYPGSKLWAATRLTWASAMQSGHYHHKLHELHTKYGPIVRIAPNELSFVSPDAWKDIYGNRNIPKNNVWTSQEEEHHPISIVSTDEATHLRNRRALTGAFTEHAIAEHAYILEDLVGLMVQKFGEAVAHGQGCAVLDTSNWLNFLTFDISGAFAFGESFHSVANGRAHPWVEISCNFGKGVGLMASINFFHPLNKLMKLAMPKNVMEKMKYHKRLVHESLMQRLAMENKTKALDYVGSVMAYNEEKGEVKIPKEEIEANLNILIFTGSETTSTAMAAIIHQLLNSPAVLERAQKEIRSTFDNEDQITVSSTAKLDYLSAVILEGMRMSPPAAVGPPRVVEREGEMISGQYVPRGTLVAVNQYPTFRSASNFTHPDSFIPERFLPKSPFSSDRLDAFEPFLLGRHKCIGQRLAWAVLRLTLSKILFTFDTKAVEERGEFSDQKIYIFWEKKPLMVELRLSGS